MSPLILVEKPWFSVIVPTYNRESSIGATLNCILRQSFPGWEIIVVDDGSSDNTGEILQGLRDERIRYIYQNNGGPSNARNTGSSLARGEYLAFIDSDDEASPHWLEELNKALDGGRYDIVCCGVIFRYKNRQKTVLPSRDPYFFKEYESLFLAGSFAVRKSLFDKIDGYDASLRFGENTDLQYRLLALGPKVTGLKEPLITYNNYDSTQRASRDITQRILAMFRTIRKHRNLFLSNRAAYATYLYGLAYQLIRISKRRRGLLILRHILRRHPFYLKGWIRLIITYVKPSGIKATTDGTTLVRSSCVNQTN